MSNQTANEILSKAEVLNSKIKAIRSEKETREGRRKAYLEQLQQGCADYKTQFGVDLWSDDMKTLFQNIQSENNREYQRLQAELEKREKVVAAYEDGDLQLMRRLLGVEDVEEVPEAEVVEVAEVVVEPAPVVQPIPVQTQGTPEQQPMGEEPLVNFFSTPEKSPAVEQMFSPQEPKKAEPKVSPVNETVITGDFGFDFGESMDDVIEDAKTEPEAPLEISTDFSFADEPVSPLKAAPPATSGMFGFGDLLEGSTLSFD